MQKRVKVLPSKSSIYLNLISRQIFFFYNFYTNFQALKFFAEVLSLTLDISFLNLFFPFVVLHYQ